METSCLPPIKASAHLLLLAIKENIFIFLRRAVPLTAPRKYFDTDLCPTSQPTPSICQQPHGRDGTLLTSVVPEALKPAGSPEDGGNTRGEAGYYPIRPHQEKANAAAAAEPTADRHRPQLAASSGSNEVIKRSLAHQSRREPTWTRARHAES